MMSKALKAFRRSYRLERKTSTHLRRALGFGVFVWLFLFVFQPFGLGTYPGSILFFTAGYGAVTMLCMVLLNALLPFVLPALFEEERWTVGHEIAWTLMNVSIIAAGNVAYTQWVLGGSLRLMGVASMVLYTLAVALIPVSLGILLNERNQRQKFRKASADINESLAHAPHHAPDALAQVAIPLKTSDGTLRVRPTDLLFVKAEENYCHFTFLRSTGASSRLVRTPLTAVEEAFSSHPAFCRVHRSYLVNLHHVRDLSGNAQGFRLHFNEVEGSVPVSRKWNGEIRDLVARYR